MEVAKKRAKVCGLSCVRFILKKGKEKDAVGEAF